MPAFNVTLTYSHRVHGKPVLSVEADTELEAERAAIKRLKSALLGADDLDISDIVVERGE